MTPYFRIQNVRLHFAHHMHSNITEKKKYGHSEQPLEDVALCHYTKPASPGCVLDRPRQRVLLQTWQTSVRLALREHRRCRLLDVQAALHTSP